MDFYTELKARVDRAYDSYMKALQTSGSYVKEQAGYWASKRILDLYELINGIVPKEEDASKSN